MDRRNFFITVMLVSASLRSSEAHVSLTYPPPRMYGLDFLDNIRTQGPCGMPRGLNPPFPLLGGIKYNFTWHSAYPHRGGYRIELLNNKYELIQPLAPAPGSPAIWANTNDPTRTHEEIELPRDECENCVVRLVRQAAEWSAGRGRQYLFRSCADVSLQSRVTKREMCSYHGTYNLPMRTCLCDKLYSGALCDVKDECTTDRDCNFNGRCLDTNPHEYPKRQCYCSMGFFGDKCQFRSQMDKPEDIDESLYAESSSGDKIRVLYRVLQSTSELEVIVQAKTNSWVGIGIKDANTRSSCQAFPQLPTEDYPDNIPTFYSPEKPTASGRFLRLQDSSQAEPEPLGSAEQSAEPEGEGKAEPEGSAEYAGEPEAESEDGGKYTGEKMADAEPKSEPTAEAEGGSHAEPKSEPTAEAEGGSHAEPKSEAEGGSHAEPKSEAEGQSHSEPEPKGESHSEPESDSEPTAESEGGPHAEPKSEAEGKPHSEPESEGEPDSKSEPTGEPLSDSEPTAEGSAEPEPKGEPESEPEAETASGVHPMDCADMVIGSARGNLGRVQDMYTRDRSTPRPDEFYGGRQSLTSAMAYEKDGRTVIMFRRKLNTADAADSVIKNENMRVIWAMGNPPEAPHHWPRSGLETSSNVSVPDFYRNDELKYHGTNNMQRGQLSINFFDKPREFLSESQSVVEERAELNGPCDGEWKTPSRCSSIDCDYRVTWKFMPGENALRFKIFQSNMKAWAGIGFSKNQQMMLSDIITGWVTPNANVIVQDRYAEGRFEPAIDRQQDIMDFTGRVEENGGHTIEFTRKLKSTDFDKDFDLSAECHYFLYPVSGGTIDDAGSESAGIGYHLQTPTISPQKICFNACF